MYYIKLFELTSQYEEYINSSMALLPNVSLIQEIKEIFYNPYINYLTFTAEEDNSTISLSSKTSPDIKYSLNRSEWTQWDYSAITLNAGDIVRMKGNNSNGFSTNNYNTFRMTGKISASGNIMSLLYDDDFEEKLTIPNDYCYSGMFSGCTSLTAAPELPATTLTTGCYSGMFSGCTSLMTAPVLPAKTLTTGCYNAMFTGCTSLIMAPEIHATTLASNCCNNMFMNCISLTTAPKLHATTLAISCYQNMFMNCSSLTTSPDLPATTLASNCCNNMFNGCTKLITAPALPATTLSDNCYASMFSGCTSLTTAPELPATTLASSCYSGMFADCASLTTAPELPAMTLVTHCYDTMFARCAKLNYIKMLAIDISAPVCMGNWVHGVSSTGTFIKHKNMNSITTGISGIPEGWTVQDAA